MNKTEIIEAVAAKSGLTKKDSEKAVNATLSTIMDALKNGEKVQLLGFGGFEVRDRAARAGHNPSTGEPISIPASRVPAFKPSQAFKNILN